MARKHTIRKKDLRSGKAQEDSEIRRAKQALSAALSSDASVESSPANDSASSVEPALQSSSGVAEVEYVEGRGLAKAFVTPARLGDHSAWALSGNPLTDLARRHVERVGQFQNSFSSPVDDHCRQVLSSRAKARVQLALRQPANQNRPFST